MPTIHETHMIWVAQLKERGESVLQPKHSEPYNKIDGYIKTQNPLKDAGAIFQDNNGTFGLFGDFGATHIEGIAWEDLGLCDSRCWYEWMDTEEESTSNVVDVFEQAIELHIANIEKRKAGYPSIKLYLDVQESGYLSALKTYRDCKKRGVI